MHVDGCQAVAVWHPVLTYPISTNGIHVKGTVLTEGCLTIIILKEVLYKSKNSKVWVGGWGGLTVADSNKNNCLTYKSHDLY